MDLAGLENKDVHDIFHMKLYLFDLAYRFNSHPIHSFKTNKKFKLICKFAFLYYNLWM